MTITVSFVGTVAYFVKGRTRPDTPMPAHRQRDPSQGDSQGRDDPACVERLSPGDLTVLASDKGQVPMQFAAVLTIASTEGLSAAELEAVLSERIRRIPRLRQRLARRRWGAWGAHWVEDADFDLARHLSVRRASGAEGMLDVAAELVCTRLDPSRPLWRACLVEGGPDRAGGLILVIHHVLADGLGGLAVLHALADDGHTATPSVRLAGPSPTNIQTGRRLRRRVIRASLAVRRSLAGWQELGLLARPRLAARTSLTSTTGPRRQLARTSAPLADVKDAAHRRGGTVNDVVIAAAVGALLDLLRHRGERPQSLVVSVPISGRPGTTASELGNQVGVRPLRVPAIPDDHARLAKVVELRRSLPGAPRASSAGPLGLVFRTLGRLGVFPWFIDRQRLVHTFVTNVRGPERRLSIAGHEVSAFVPVAVAPGNVTISFVVLSYAGELTITVVVDPERVPELPLLAGSLQRRLYTLMGRGKGGAGESQ